MNKPLFTGVCTALVTPFLDGRVNYPMMEQLLRRQLEAGIRAVVVCGTTGEAPTLSDNEKLELIRRCKEYAGDRCLILAGTGTNATDRTLELSLAAQEEGADALLVVTPYYNKPTQDGLVAHYMTLAHSLRIPVIIYNVPSRTGVDISVESCRILSRVEGILGIKEASRDMGKIAALLAACPREFALWSGNDDLTAPILSLGGAGVISVVSNLLPLQTRALAEAALAGDFDTAASLQLTLDPLIRALFAEGNPLGIKEAMKCMGFDCGPCRPPLSALSPQSRARLEQLLSAERI